MIRRFRITDIPQLILLDKKSYGKYGADEKYFLKKNDAKNVIILVSEKEGKIDGFSLVEIIDKNGKPEDFSYLNINKTLNSKWMLLIAFTTVSNYLDFENDSKLLKKSEKEAEKLDCRILCVPLSIDHPYPKALDFFEKNGYTISGSLNWKSDNGDKIQCYLFRKDV